MFVVILTTVFALNLSPNRPEIHAYRTATWADCVKRRDLFNAHITFGNAMSPPGFQASGEASCKTYYVGKRHNV